jgi:hypothetical protein
VLGRRRIRSSAATTTAASATTAAPASAAWRRPGLHAWLLEAESALRLLDGVYAVDAVLSSVRERVPGRSLLDVLSTGGGGLEALGRHVVAALLNAASSGVSYNLTTAQVVAEFGRVYPGGDYEGLKNRLAGYNEQGCPLN